jgi:hypothetical protein
LCGILSFQSMHSGTLMISLGISRDDKLTLGVTHAVSREKGKVVIRKKENSIHLKLSWNDGQSLNAIADGNNSLHRHTKFPKLCRLVEVYLPPVHRQVENRHPCPPAPMIRGISKQTGKSRPIECFGSCMVHCWSRKIILTWKSNHITSRKLSCVRPLWDTLSPPKT